MFFSRSAARCSTAGMVIVCVTCLSVAKSHATLHTDNLRHIQIKSNSSSEIPLPNPGSGYLPIEPKIQVFGTGEIKVTEGGSTATIDTCNPDTTLKGGIHFYKEETAPPRSDPTLLSDLDYSQTSKLSVTSDAANGFKAPPRIIETELEATMDGKQGCRNEVMPLAGPQTGAKQVYAGSKYTKGVFRHKLGNFEDPMQFFSDFKTERKKTGLRAEQKTGMLKTIGLIYDSEREVGSREQGLAGRFTFENTQWMAGGSYTMRRAIDNETGGDEKRDNSYATAVDFRFPLFDTLEVLLEVASSKDPENNEDLGYLLRGEYDLGQIHLSGGYIDLGEYFEASYADPLHHVNRDAGGIEASVDYCLVRPLWAINKLETTLRFFDLTRHSNSERLNELDGSLRIDIGENNNLFFSIFNRDEGQLSNQSLIGSLIHNWNEKWSSELQSNYSETPTGNTLKITVDASLEQDDNSTKVAVDWLKREIDSSSLSLYEESRIRIDLNQKLWRLQLQGKLNENREDSGTNFYGRVEYKPTSLQRYQLVGYAAVGEQAAFDFVERFEVGMKFSF